MDAWHPFASGSNPSISFSVVAALMLSMIEQVIAGVFSFCRKWRSIPASSKYPAMPCAPPCFQYGGIAQCQPSAVSMGLNPSASGSGCFFIVHQPARRGKFVLLKCFYARRRQPRHRVAVQVFITAPAGEIGFPVVEVRYCPRHAPRSRPAIGPAS